MIRRSPTSAAVVAHHDRRRALDPLSAEARRILLSVPRVGAETFVFPGAKGGRPSMTGAD